jgi:hypothetical protein
MLSAAPYIPQHNAEAGKVLTRTNLLLTGDSELGTFDDITDKVGDHGKFENSEKKIKNYCLLLTASGAHSTTSRIRFCPSPPLMHSVCMRNQVIRCASFSGHQQYPQ